MLIKELVNVDNHGAFIPAVQLADFDTPETNRSLVRSFIFTGHAPTNTGMAANFYSTLEILEKLKNSFQADSDNVIMLLADYGHGKSHLGLEVMNYFGQPMDSEEFAAVMERVETASGSNNPLPNNLKTFRKNREKPFLVLHMSGDSNKSIREMFYNALLKELRRHGILGKVHLPFWNENAKNWLYNQKENLTVIDLLGNEYGTDIPTLLQDIDLNRDGAWEKYVAVFEMVNFGNRPDAAEHKNPEEMVDWVMLELVGENKPFSGLTIFFDEFSIFLRTAANRADDLDIPQLLHGVGAHKYRGRALLLLLGHRDPVEDLKTAITNPTHRGQLLHHIGRIHIKWQLFTVVESVLDSFLANSRTAWEDLKRESPLAIGEIIGATAENSHTYFKSRYERDLDWDYEKYLNVVVKGCFPLHPTTTALLSSVRLRMENIGAARSLLTFVRKVYLNKKDLPIFENGRTNWVLPVDLVEFFGDALVDDLIFSQYDSILRNIRTQYTQDDPSTALLVAKALLLQIAAKFDQYSGFKQEDLLSHFSGLTGAVTKKALKKMDELSIIRFDPISNRYTFRVVNGGMDVMDEIKRLAANKSLDIETSKEITKEVSLGDLKVQEFGNIDIAVDWGHPSDWYVSQFIVTRANFDKEALQNFVPQVKFGPTEPKAQAKGALVWCLAGNDADRDYFKARTPTILADAFGDITAPPIIVMIPDLPSKNLVDGFFMYLSAKKMLVTPEMIEKYGDLTIRNEINSLERRIKLELQKFLQQQGLSDQVNETFFVPAAYTSEFINFGGGNFSFSAKFLKMYRKSYQIGVNSFFTDVRAYTNGSTVSASAKKVGAHLSMNNLQMLMVQGVPGAIDKRLVDNYLKNSWGIISPNYAVVEPKQGNLARVWKEFDDHFQVAEGEFKVGPILQKLLNPPYGFDANTVWLVFCAWIGTRPSSIHIYKKSFSISIKSFMAEFNTATRTVSVNLNRAIVEGKLTLSRSTPGLLDEEIKRIINLLQYPSTSTPNEAKQTMVILEDFIETGNDEAFLQQAQNALDSLKIAERERIDYEEKWKKIKEKVQRANHLRELILLNKDLRELHEPNLIQSEYSLPNLQKQIVEKTEKIIAALLEKSANFEKITDAGLYQEELKTALEAVMENTEWAEQIRNAIRLLEQRIKKLTTVKQEGHLQAQIRVLTLPKLPLKTARQNLSEIIRLEVSESLLVVKNDAIASLQKQISETEGKAKYALSNYLKVDEDDLNLFRNDVFKSISLFSESEFEQEFDTMNKYLDSLQRYFTKVRRIKENQSENYSAILGCLKEVEGVKSEFAEILSSDHMVPLNKLCQEFESRKAKVERQADQDLRNLEGILEQEKAKVSGTLDVSKYKAVLADLAQLGMAGLNDRLSGAKQDLDTIKKIMDTDFTKSQIETLFKKLNANEREEILFKLSRI